jgi:hypothetical protein
VKESSNRKYNDWMLPRFPLYSWGHGSCNSYYRFDDGRAPFLFPGDFKTYKQMQDDGGLNEYEVAERDREPEWGRGSGGAAHSDR